MRPIKVDDYWGIKVFTKEFGEVLLLEHSKITPVRFKNREEALDFIESKREEGVDEVEKIKRKWENHKHIIKKASGNYGDDEIHPMLLDDIKQVEWLIEEIEGLNNGIDMLMDEVEQYQKVNEVYKNTLLKISKPDDKKYINEWRRFYEKHGEISFQEYTKYVATKALKEGEGI